MTLLWRCFLCRHCPRKGRGAGLAAMLASLLMAATAQAGVRVEPLRLSISDDARVTELRVTNTRARSSLLQASVQRWHQEDGAMRLEAAPELLVSPPVFVLEPDAVQTVRIGRREGGTLEREQAYRVIVEEVPTEDAEGGGLKMVMRLLLPLFIGPSDARPELHFRRGDDCLHVTNRGDRHSRLTAVEVRQPLPGGTPSWQPLDIAAAPYVLAGSARCLPLPTAAGFDRVRYSAADEQRELPLP